MYFDETAIVESLIDKTAWFENSRMLTCSSAEVISFLLRVTCVICERAINTDVWQAMVARAIESQKNSSEPL